MEQGTDIGTRPPTHGTHRTPLRTGIRVFALGGLVCAIIVAAALAVLAPLASGQRSSESATRYDLPIQRQAAAFRATLVRWQLLLEPRIDAYQAGAGFTPVDISQATGVINEQNALAKSFSSALRARGLASEARSLRDVLKNFNASIDDLSPIATGTRVAPKELARVVGNERTAYSRLWELASDINKDVSLHTTTPDVQHASDQFRLARTLIAVIGTALVALALIVTGFSARRAARRHRTQDLATQRVLYGSELQQALEFSPTEDDVYDVVRQALRATVPQLNVELLIADSSNAHFRQVFGATQGLDHADGCGVVSPRDCPAAIRGHTLEFASSDAISACRYLKNRPSGSCSAVCIPVSISGSTVGVMHATGRNGTLPAAGDLENIELSARRGAERVALLRAFAKSETQASTDPLTGLLNRRSLENRVRELHRGGTPYALAYGDLDFFKALNDTHGHETGDQALRLFSRVMRDAVRPADLVSRYGGEEFVIVLPECDAEGAVAVLERVRERLALELMSGRIPAFTVSFGVATSADATTFDEIVAAADQALLAAKSAGRDRTLLAGEPATAW
jgi:diguanylate cyclase (GGDEF)-like protein